MPHTQPAAKPFPTWLQRKMDENDLRNRDLVALSKGTLKASNITRWLSGSQLPTPDNAVELAHILREPPHEVLRISGHELLADLIKPDAGTPTDPHEAEVINEVLAADLLSDEEKAMHIRAYRRDVAYAQQRLLQIARDTADSRRNPRAS